MSQLEWEDEFEIAATKLVLVQRPDDAVAGDELHHLVTSLGVSKIRLSEDMGFYSLNIGKSYINLTPHEFEQLFMRMKRVLEQT